MCMKNLSSREVDRKTFSSRDELNQALLDQLDEATEPWGVKVTRVEVQSIDPRSESVLESMQQQQAALEKVTVRCWRRQL